jgi:hypothetical protein
MISQATITGAGFSITGGMPAVSLAAGQSRVYQIQFAPQAVGAASGNISVSSNAVNSPLSVALGGAALAALAITAQPVSQSIVAGQTATFTVGATGAGTITYQWKKNGTAINGATSPSYTTPASTISDNGEQFTVVVDDGSGSITSSAAGLTVTAAPTAPTITKQPANLTVLVGQQANFSVAASGTAILKYQWKKNGAIINGATAASYTIPATATSDNGAQFTVTVSNSVGSITSSAATLTVNSASFLLSANPTSLSFSNVSTGSSSVKTVSFTNTGNSNVTISGVSVSGAGFTAGGISSGQLVQPGKTATLNVTFAPASAGSVTGSATVTSNAATSPATISISGTGVQPVAHTVALAWTASTSTVSGYNVYRSPVSGGPYVIVNSSPVSTTSFVDSTVQSGQTYFYAATSVDPSGNESTFSTEATATIP